MEEQDAFADFDKPKKAKKTKEVEQPEIVEQLKQTEQSEPVVKPNDRQAAIVDLISKLKILLGKESTNWRWRKAYKLIEEAQRIVNV